MAKRTRKSIADVADLERQAAELAGVLAGSERLADFIARISPHHPPPRHAARLIDIVERARQQRIRTCVSWPPRHAKTTITLHGLAWWLRNSPADTCGYFSFNDDLARSKSRIARRLALEAGVELAPDSANLGEWRTTRGGGLLAGGAGSGFTGQGVSGLLVIDDPVKDREAADSSVIRNRIWEWFNEVAYTRLEGASAVVIGTRWHSDDLIGRLEATGEWEVINLPAIAEDDDPIGRQAGEALWPERFSVEELESIKRQIGPWSFSALYEGRPRPRGAAVFGDPARFDASTWTPSGARVVIGADPAASEKTSADYSSAVVLAVEGRGDQSTARVLDVYRKQVGIPQLVKDLRRLSAKWWNAPIAVEAVGGFIAVPQMLRQVNPLLRLVEVKLRGDKFTRAQAVAAAWNDNRVLVPTSASWVSIFLDEMQRFTGSKDKHDDQVDALAHAWNAIHVGATVTAATLDRHARRARPGPSDEWSRPLAIAAAR